MNSTESKGYYGEFLAILLLKIKRYKILARRYKTSLGEIDIIASKNNTLVFVEVKARKTVEKCYIAISDKQLQRIQRASGIFINRNRNFQQYFIRFDVILVSDWKWPIHIQNVSM
jgi:putative endonuclease